MYLYKFPFLEQFNTQKEQPPRLPLFLYPPSRKALFYAVTMSAQWHLIGKVVEKSGIAWYNGFIRVVNLPDKSGFIKERGIVRYD